MSSIKDSDTVVSEGLAEIYQPTSVFYNPVQEFNRDLTIAVISEFALDHAEFIQEQEEKSLKRKCKGDTEIINTPSNLLSDNSSQEQITLASENIEVNKSRIPCEAATQKLEHSKGLKILEGLAASGLRSIRFAKEIPGVQSIIANDFDKNAVSYINHNIEHNGVHNIVKSSLNDAAMVMYQHKRPSERFDVVDLDPYGSPSQFLDAAVQGVRDGGLLCVTCTDMAVMCGNSPETCYSKYGSMSLKCKFCHEMALRIILQSIQSHANRYSRYIKPMISISADFYVRVFVQVFTGQKVVKKSVTKLSMVYHCGGCGAFSLQPLGIEVPTKNNQYKYSPSCGPPITERCEHCNSRHHLGGPIWSDPLYNIPFIERVLKRIKDDPSKFTTSDRMTGLLTVMTEELQDVPLYYVSENLFSMMHLTEPKLVQMRSAILNAGYRVSLSHAARNSIKSDAPLSVLWDIIRCWAKKKPINPKHMINGTIVHKILSKEPTLEANFELHPDAEPRSKGLVRWQENPKRDWGPKPRAKKGEMESVEERRLKGMEKARERSQLKRKENEGDLKMIMCKRFKDGKCNLGEECKYSHHKDCDSN